MGGYMSMCVHMCVHMHVGEQRKDRYHSQYHLFLTGLELTHQAKLTAACSRDVYLCALWGYKHTLLHSAFLCGFWGLTSDSQVLYQLSHLPIQSLIILNKGLYILILYYSPLTPLNNVTPLRSGL